MSDNEPMRRTRMASIPGNRGAVLDHVADYAYDAIDAGVEPEAVVSALREAAGEVEELDDRDHFEADRHEPADFGGGESAGVEDL